MPQLTCAQRFWFVGLLVDSWHRARTRNSYHSRTVSRNTFMTSFVLEALIESDVYRCTDPRMNGETGSGTPLLPLITPFTKYMRLIIHDPCLANSSSYMALAHWILNHYHHHGPTRIAFRVLFKGDNVKPRGSTLWVSWYGVVRSGSSRCSICYHVLFPPNSPIRCI